MTMAIAVVFAVDESNVNPGLLGFVVVALLGVATWLLIRSMQRHLRKVNFDDDDDDEGAASPDQVEPGTRESDTGRQV